MGAPLIRRVMESVSWLAAAQVLRRVVTLGTTALLARLLKPEDFGLLGMATTLVGLLSILTDVGFPAALIQRKEVREEELSTVFWSSLAISFGLTLAGLACIYPLSWFYHEPRVVPLCSVLLCTLPMSGLATTDAILQRRLAFRQIAIMEFSNIVLVSVVGIVMALSNFGVWALVGQYLTTQAVSAIGRLWLAGFIPRFRFDWKVARGLALQRERAGRYDHQLRLAKHRQRARRWLSRRARARLLLHRV